MKASGQIHTPWKTTTTPLANDLANGVQQFTSNRCGTCVLLTYLSHMLLGPTFTSAQKYSVLRRCTAGATVSRQKMITSRCHGLFYARLGSGGHNNHRRHVWKYINNLINDGNKFEQRYFLLVFRWRREPTGGGSSQANVSIAVCMCLAPELY